MAASTPLSGFLYKIGVKNIKNVINTERAFPISLTTPLRREKIKPSPSVSNIIGIVNIGINKIFIFGAIL